MPLPTAVGAYVKLSWQPVPVLTFEHAKLPDVPLQPLGNAESPDVTDRLFARLWSSVVKVTLTGVVLPVTTATGFGLGVPTTLSWVVARYTMFNEPLVLGTVALSTKT